jgi:hypothetical protein
MTPGPRGSLLEQLVELVEALDRRLPSLRRAGEARIAREAAALRAEAEKRIMQLKEVPQ